LNSTNSVVADTWQHVAGTFNGTTLRVYLNKNLDGENEATGFSGTLNLNSNDAVIGNSENQTAYDYAFGFNGTIDEVRISNTTQVFTPIESITEINLTYNTTHPNIDAVRVYYWNTTTSAIQLIDEVTTLNGVPSFNKTIFDLPIGQYKIEIEDTNTDKIEKWYPSPPTTPFACISQNNLDKITIISNVCPSVAFDAIPRTDINFVNCV